MMAIVQMTFSGAVAERDENHRHRADQRPDHWDRLTHSHDERQAQGIRQADRRIPDQRHEADHAAEDDLPAEVGGDLPLHLEVQLPTGLAALEREEQQDATDEYVAFLHPEERKRKDGD